MLQRDTTITPDTPTTSRATPRPPRRPWEHLTDTDRVALGYWLAAHLALLALAYAAAWAFRDTGTAHLPLTGGYQQWDANLYQSLAQYGYFGGPGGKPAHPNQVAFWPGYPLALAAVHAIARNWVASELLLSLAAGAVAVVALARLADDRRAVLLLLTAPAAAFLLVGYSESLFLAFAIPAWYAARHGNWTAAGILAFAAAFTRVNGLFLLAGLLAMALTAPKGPRWRALAGIAPALGAPILYQSYLYAATGHWDAWMRANRDGWGLYLTWPWNAARTTWRMAFEHQVGTGYAFEAQLELACMAAGLLGALALAALRRWPEAVYVGCTFAALACQSRYESVPRSLLLAFPLFALVGVVPVAHRRWVTGAWVAVCGPLAVVYGVLYASGRWAG